MTNSRSLIVTAALAAAVLATVAFPAPALAQQAAAYTNPLDSQSDVSGWYFYDYYNWWAVDNSPIAGHDGNASLNINDGTSVDQAYNLYMYFESTPIDISGLDTPILSFWCLADLPDPNNNYYYRYFDIYDSNYNYYYEWSMGPSGWGDLTCTDQWHQHMLPIPADIASAGSLLLDPYCYFENYGDSNLQGWFIDQIQILVADTTPPDAVADLAAVNPTLTEIEVTWSAPHDDDVSGVTASYDLRYSTSPITGTNFAQATQVTGEPTPDVEGTPHSVLVTGLTEATTYYFAIQTTDIAGNVSAISNVASVATLTPPPPPPPPPAPNVIPEVEEPPKDILPCSAGTSAAPNGMLILAGLVALAAFAGAMKK
jgi:purple acid phosphatase-like protein